MEEFLGVLEFKAPLIAVLPTPLYRLFGRHSRVAYGVNLIFMALLFGAVYRLARRFSNPRAGLIAVYLTATMPLLFGLSRQYLVEYGLTALVAASVCCLLESRSLGDDRKACCLGTLCGLGLMMKITFPLYVFLPFCFAWVQFSSKASPTPPSNAHPRPARSSVLMWWLAFVAPLALIALPWYGRNWPKTFDHAFRSGFSPMADQYGMGDPYSFAIVWRYLAHWVNDGISGGILSVADGIGRNSALVQDSNEAAGTALRRPNPGSSVVSSVPRVLVWAQQGYSFHRAFVASSRYPARLDG